MEEGIGGITLEEEHMEGGKGGDGLREGGGGGEEGVQFHPVCLGSSIQLEEGGRRAVREKDSFCNGN